MESVNSCIKSLDPKNNIILWNGSTTGRREKFSEVKKEEGNKLKINKLIK